MKNKKNRFCVWLLLIVGFFYTVCVGVWNEEAVKQKIPAGAARSVPPLQGFFYGINRRLYIACGLPLKNTALKSRYCMGLLSRFFT